MKTALFHCKSLLHTAAHWNEVSQTLAAIGEGNPEKCVMILKCTIRIYRKDNTPFFWVMVICNRQCTNKTVQSHEMLLAWPSIRQWEYGNGPFTLFKSEPLELQIHTGPTETHQHVKKMHSDHCPQIANYNRIQFSCSSSCNFFTNGH